MNYDYYVLRWGLAPNEKDDYGLLMWDEARQKKNIHICNVPRFLREEEGQEFHSIYCDDKRFKKIFYRLYLKDAKIAGYKKNVVLINDTHLCLKNLPFIEYLKNKYEAITVLYFLNQIRNKLHPATMGVDLRALQEKFDYIITDDYEDATRFGLYYISDPYSRLNINKTEDKYDIYYTGWDKNRTEITKKLAMHLKKNGVNASINLVRKDNKIAQEEYINYTTWKSYPNIIQEVQNANCLLELIEENQTATTFRYLEALCYNKKLLSNNANIVNYKGYDPRYMKIFKNIEDIDINFIKRREDVDYNYTGWFSPVNYIKNVEKIIQGEIKSL